MDPPFAASIRIQLADAPNDKPAIDAPSDATPASPALPLTSLLEPGLLHSHSVGILERPNQKTRTTHLSAELLLPCPPALDPEPDEEDEVVPLDFNFGQFHTCRIQYAMLTSYFMMLMIHGWTSMSLGAGRDAGSRVRAALMKSFISGLQTMSSSSSNSGGWCRYQYHHCTQQKAEPEKGQKRS